MVKKPRLDLWSEPERIVSGLTLPDGADASLLDELVELQQSRARCRKDAGPGGFTTSDIIRSCKEIIFDVEDGRFIFHFIRYSINAERIEIELSHLMSSVPEEDAAENLKEVLSTLAIAKMLDVPVFPNTEEVGPELLRLHRELLSKGFEAPGEGGSSVRLVLMNPPAVDSPSCLKELPISHSLTPAELTLARDSLVAELDVHERAAATLTAIRVAIEDLGELLKNSTDEASLQRCLTENPLLFGPDYISVVPKHRLGAEFEMDYALIRPSGLADLVEIERSTYAIFTKSGNPSQFLVHAEQQVLDWLDWIDRHGEYARESIPGLFTPKGIVVIGRSVTLGKSDRDRLVRRNLILRPSLEILTFDDLLNRAKALLAFLNQQTVRQDGAMPGRKTADY
jgi:hypothetical protein